MRVLLSLVISFDTCKGRNNFYRLASSHPMKEIIVELKKLLQLMREPENSAIDLQSLLYASPIAQLWYHLIDYQRRYSYSRMVSP